MEHLNIEEDFSCFEPPTVVQLAEEREYLTKVMDAVCALNSVVRAADYLDTKSGKLLKLLNREIPTHIPGSYWKHSIGYHRQPGVKDQLELDFGIIEEDPF